MAPIPKLRFPGMSDRKFQVFHERLVRDEAAARKKFKRAADAILPGWDANGKLRR